MEHVVTVGLDGSDESLAAAHWAAEEADRRKATLHLLHAWPMLAPEAVGTPPETDQNYWAKLIVHNAHTELREHHPDLRIVEDLVASDATSALLNAAQQVRLLVLGSRGLSHAASFFLGDTSMDVVAQAACPVALVRADTGPSPDAAPRTAEVAVGVSLHGPCEDLLEFAFTTAASREVPLHAVHGRSLPAAAYVPWAMAPQALEKVTADAQKELGDALRPWRKKFTGVRVVEDVQLESPARTVVDAASAADLLMIGRRRHRHALAPRLGNVAYAAAHHAPCPVVVVPHD